MTRRSFLQKTAAATVGGAMALSLPGCTSSNSNDPALMTDPGVQLYTVRELMEEDFEGTLARIAEMGYGKVEFAGYFGRSASEVRAILDRHGLSAPSAHVMLEAIREQPEALIEQAKTIGFEYLVLPYLMPEQRQTLDDYREVAATLEGFREQCAEEDLVVGYHNHDFEFEAMDGTRPYDVLLEETEVVMELDLFWVADANVDAMAYFEAHAGRFELLHLKDRTATGEMAPVGAGELNFAGLLGAARDAGLKHAFVEHDNPADPMASIQSSLTYLTEAGGG